MIVRQGVKASHVPKTVRVMPKVASLLSEERRQQLADDVLGGRIREGHSYAGSPLVRGGAAEPPPQPMDRGIVRGTWAAPYDPYPARSRKSDMGSLAAVAHSPSYKKAQLEKTAATTATSGGRTTSAGASVERLAPEVYSPLFTMANLNLPRDRITVNAWLRNFYDLHPIVRNAITLHATYPISKLTVKCANHDVENFFNDMAEEMDLLGVLSQVALEYWKMGECVPGNSMITTKNGDKRAVDIQVGDLVLTHEGRFRKVAQRLVNWKHSEVIGIRARCFPEVMEVSGNHPIMAVNMAGKTGYMKRCVVKNGVVTYVKDLDKGRRWTAAENLSKGDLLVIPVNRDVEDNSRMTAQWCRMLGLWLAEGSFGKNTDGEVKHPIISNYNDNLWRDYESVFDKCGMRLVKSKTNGNGALRSKAAGRWKTAEEARFLYKNAGQYSGGKILSRAVMLLPPKKQLEIIAGFVDGDGWIHRGAIEMGTVSRNLAIQFRQILARNWILASVGLDKRSERREDRKNLYTICIPGMYAKKFTLCSRLSGKLDRQRKLHPSRPNSLPRNKFGKDGHILSPIISVDRRRLSKGEPLFNFEVEEDNSYCSHGFAVHNCFPYAELDEHTGKWRKIIIQNPDYIHVKKTVVSSEPVISLRPDKVLQRIVMSNNPADIQLRKQIPTDVLYHVRKGQNIPLDNFNVSHLKLLSSPYDVRGTSVIVSVFKDLMLYDKLREAKYAQADGLVNPITLVKVGGTAEGEYHPTPEDIEYWRNIIEEAQYDKDFKIITHAGMAIERVGASGSVLEVGSDIDLIIKNVFWGLMVPQAVVDSESAAYASASIGLEVLRQRYFNFRNMLAKWLVNKIFAPISEIQGFYEYKDGEKRLIVPEVEWNHMNLYDLQDYVANISSLVTSKQASLQTLYRSLGLNYEEERKKMRHEMIDNVITQREEAVLGTLPLTHLRSIDPEQEIMEPLPGEEGMAPVGGMGAMPGGMGGEMGGMPGGMPGGLGGGGGMGPLGMPELGPPGAGGEMGGPGAPMGGGATPPLGPGTPGAAPIEGGPGGLPPL